MLRELLTPDIECVKRIRSVGTVFKKILFRFGILLIVLVLAESQPPTIHLCRLYGKNQVIVVLTVEERHEPLLSGKATVDEQVFLIMLHRIAEIDINDFPSPAFKLMHNDPVEVLFIHRIV